MVRFACHCRATAVQIVKRWQPCAGLLPLHVGVRVTRLVARALQVDFPDAARVTMVLGPAGYSWLMGLSGVGAVLVRNSLMKAPQLARA